MIDQLRKRGYGYGTGFLSPDCSQFVVSIPKNASSYLLDWCSQYDWTNAVVGDSCDWYKVSEVIVVLRDPLNRWVSGIGQYITSYILNVTGAYDWSTGPSVDDRFLSADEFISSYNPVVERMLFDNLDRHDDHVWPQYEFFKDLLPGVQRKYFYIDKDFDLNFSSYMGFSVIEDLDKNQGDDNADTKKVQQFIKGRLNIRPELKQRVINAYDSDYKLIEEVLNVQTR